MKTGVAKRKYLLVIILSLFSLSNCFGADLLDGVKNNTKLVNDLKDVYRAFNIVHVISNQKELLNIYLDENSATLDHFLTQYMNVCRSLEQTQFSNEVLRSKVNKFLSATIQNYKIAERKGFDSKDFKIDYKKYAKQNEELMDYLIRTYPTSYFVSLSEKKYWNNIDKKNYIRSKDYQEYEKLKKSDTKSAQSLLDHISKQSANFQEYAIYQIESADLYVKHPDLSADDPKIPVNKYKSLVDQKKYCIYLFEAWLKWRTVLQQSNGLSKSSDIPNDEYNKVREQTALTILNYITDHPKDEMAINEFLLMATHDNIKRFGEYQFGNQNTLEYHEMFDEN